MKRYENIMNILQSNYGLTNVSIAEANGGWASKGYRIETHSGAIDNETYYLKYYDSSRSSTDKWTALIDIYMPIVEYLNTNTDLKGNMIDLVKTKDNKFKVVDNSGVYMLFMWIDGKKLFQQPIPKDAAKQLGKNIGTLHNVNVDNLDTSLIEHIAQIKDQFDIPFNEDLKDFMSLGYDDIVPELRETIGNYTSYINKMIIMLDQIKERLITEKKEGKLQFVLCHTDLHGGNMLLTSEGLKLLDWEGLTYAPKEADFFALINETFYEDYLIGYRDKHPCFTINEIALKFYSLRRDIEDIWEHVEIIQYDSRASKDFDQKLIDENIYWLNKLLKTISKYDES